MKNKVSANLRENLFYLIKTFWFHGPYLKLIEIIYSNNHDFFQHEVKERIRESQFFEEKMELPTKKKKKKKKNPQQYYAICLLAFITASILQSMNFTNKKQYFKLYLK